MQSDCRKERITDKINLKMRRIRRYFMLFLTGTGIVLMLYPWFSNWLYQNAVQSKVKVYEQHIQKSAETDGEKELDRARRYNQELLNNRVKLTEPYCGTEYQEDMVYEEVLNSAQTGIMCFVEIPEIDLFLPVYHGTSEEVLKKGAGHMKGSALPVGGTGNRSLILAHTGMNTSRMFSDLPRLEEGDVFYIHVLNLRLIYRVCEIQTVLPEEAEAILPDRDRDLVTLVTCTPYGVNTHRLLVTGERTFDADSGNERQFRENDTQKSNWTQAYREAIVLGGMITGILLLIMEICRKVKKGQKNSEKENAGKECTSDA